jgi:hypothetical protein
VFCGAEAVDWTPCLRKCRRDEAQRHPGALRCRCRPRWLSKTLPEAAPSIPRPEGASCAPVNTHTHTLPACLPQVTLVSTTKERKPWVRPPIAMSFQIPMLSTSSVRVQYLKVRHLDDDDDDDDDDDGFYSRVCAPTTGSVFDLARRIAPARYIRDGWRCIYSLLR